MNVVLFAVAVLVTIPSFHLAASGDAAAVAVAAVVASSSRFPHF